MAAQHHENVPAVGNQISADIPDIAEALMYHWDAFGLIFSTQDATTIGNNVFGPSNGSYTFALPTNGVAANGVFMTGNSSTIAWFYLDSAPPGWKAYTGVTDCLLGVVGSGTGSEYTATGGSGTEDGDWTAEGHAHTHTMGTHKHTWLDPQGASSNDLDGAGTTITRAVATSGTHIVASTGSVGYVTNAYLETNLVDPGDTNSGGDTSDGSWRPKAAVGKLFQLDTA